jgi:hypothetical protein
MELGAPVARLQRRGVEGDGRRRAPVLLREQLRAAGVAIDPKTLAAFKSAILRAEDLVKAGVV